VSAFVKQPLTEVRGFILRSKQTLQHSPNMPEPYTRTEALGPTHFRVGLHRLLDRAERTRILCGPHARRLAPAIPRYSAVPPCVDRDTRDNQHRSAIPPAIEVAGFLGVPSMFNSLGVQVPYPARWRRRISEAQGRRREAGSERSVEQTYEPMNKNQIRGIACGTSGPRTTKSISIKHTSCRSGGCVRKAVELTSGDLPFAVRSRLRVERSILTGRQKSAEGVLAGQPGEGPNGPAQAG
jgi:hypothetical protein